MASFSREDILKDMENAANRVGLNLEDLRKMVGNVLSSCIAKTKSM